MVDPENLLVWHSDYVDHVDEENLCGSFEDFLQKIDFKILGVTKDKWKASTNAIKTVFHNILGRILPSSLFEKLLRCTIKISKRIKMYRPRSGQAL